jgi:hypothetical protein
MNGSKTNRAPSTKPVNINISFTINPKNILNQQSYGIDKYIILQFIVSLKIKKYLIQYKYQILKNNLIILNQKLLT